MKRMRALWISGLVMAFFVAAVIWVRSYKPMARKWVLSSGAEVELVRVTFGKNHRAIDGGWKDMVYPAVPKALLPKLKWQVGNYGPTTNDSLVAWLRVNSLGANTNRRGSQLQLRIAVLDGNGLESPFSTFLFNTSSVPRALELRSYPRRSPEMTIRIYDSSTAYEAEHEPGSKLGEFKIPNPVPSRATSWVAEKMPASRSTSGLTISLVKLQTGFAELMGSEISGRTNGMGGKYSRAVIDFEENGKRSTDWWVSKISASSASGEQLRPSSSGGFWGKEGYVYNFQGALWLDESVWKLTIETMRSGRFPVQELWKVRGIRAPQSNEVVEVHAKTNICGVETELIGLGGPEAKPPEGWSSLSRSARTAKLRVRLADPNGDVRLSLISVQDQQGKSMQAYHYITGNDVHEFQVEIPEGASKLDVTLAASRSRTVEFLVKPELAK
jgi:hypothetical protein